MPTTVTKYGKEIQKFLGQTTLNSINPLYNWRSRKGIVKERRSILPESVWGEKLWNKGCLPWTLFSSPKMKLIKGFMMQRDWKCYSNPSSILERLFIYSHSLQPEKNCRPQSHPPPHWGRGKQTILLLGSLVPNTRHALVCSPPIVLSLPRTSLSTGGKCIS